MSETEERYWITKTQIDDLCEYGDSVLDCVIDQILEDQYLGIFDDKGKRLRLQPQKGEK